MYPVTHGNYCGAYWSDGKFQKSVKNGKSFPVDAVDAVCQQHDADIAAGISPYLADEKFIKNIKTIPGITARIAQTLINAQLMVRKLAGQEYAMAVDARGVVIPASRPGGPAAATPNLRSEPSSAAPIIRDFRPVESDAPTQSKRSSRLTIKMPPKKTKPAPKKRKQTKNVRSQFGELTMAPVSMTRSFTSGSPETSNLANGSIRVRHREYIGDITSTGTGFVVTNTFPVNPGLAACFPWLSSVAIRYEKYKFNDLKYIYDPESSTAGAGCVLMAVDFDASDVPPINKQYMTTYVGATKSAPYLGSVMHAKKSFDQTIGFRYTRGGTNPATTDIKLYDVGTFYLATSGVPAGLIGDLYVEYDVTFITPQQQQPLGQTILPTGTNNAANPFGTGTPTVLGNSIATVTNSTTLTFSLTGEYLISFAGVGTASSLAISGTSTSRNYIIRTDATNFAGYMTQTVTAPNQTAIVSVNVGALTSVYYFVSLLPTTVGY